MHDTDHALHSGQDDRKVGVKYPLPDLFCTWRLRWVLFLYKYY